MFQPLHIGHKEDLGANKVQIKWFRNSTNLHSLWDGALIDGEKLSYTEYAAFLERTHKPVAPDFSFDMILNSAWNTYQITEQLYKTADQTANSYRYIYDYKAVWEQQLVNGGILLASLLNYIYG
jgi:hypothetical protein